MANENFQGKPLMWYLYILEFNKGQSLYTGITTDVDKRLQAHQKGTGAKSLRGKGPIQLVYTEQFENATEARKREYAIKQWPRENKLKLIFSSRKSKGLSEI